MKRARCLRFLLIILLSLFSFLTPNWNALQEFDGSASGAAATDTFVIPQFPSHRSISDLEADASGNLYFVSDLRGPREIFAWTPGEREPRLLFPHLMGASKLRVSPDGAQVGFVHGSEIWVGNLKSGGARAWSKLGLQEIESFSWLDGQTLVVSAGRPGSHDLYRVSIARTELLSGDPRDEVQVEAAPDGKRFAYLRRETKWFEKTALIVRSSIKNGRELELVARSGVVFVFYQHGAVYHWKNNREIYYLSDQDDWRQLYSVDIASGKNLHITLQQGDIRRFAPVNRQIVAVANSVERGVEWLLKSCADSDAAAGNVNQAELRPLISMSGVVESFAAGGERVYFLFSTPRTPAELYVHDLKLGTTTQLSHLSPEEWNNLKLADARIAQFMSRDVLIEGVLYVPPHVADALREGVHDADLQKTFPAVVMLHGGPSMQDTFSWSSLRQQVALSGFVVLCPNYRGSLGYGRKFEEADDLKIGEVDAADVAAAARFLQTLPFVDKGRIGVCGASYGGYLTNLVVGKYPELFRAGVSWYGIAHWPTLYAFKRLHPVVRQFFESRMRRPEQQPWLYRAASPTNYVSQIRAPLLLVHGSDDVVVPPAQSINFAEKLEGEGKIHKLVIYPGERHGWRQPEHAREATEMLVGWFRKYLGMR